MSGNDALAVPIGDTPLPGAVTAPLRGAVAEPVATGLVPIGAVPGAAVAPQTLGTVMVVAAAAAAPAVAVLVMVSVMS